MVAAAAEIQVGEMQEDAIRVGEELAETLVGEVGEDHHLEETAGVHQVFFISLNLLPATLKQIR